MGKIVCSIHAQHMVSLSIYMYRNFFVVYIRSAREKKNPLKNHTKKSNKEEKKAKNTKKDKREQCSKKEKVKNKNGNGNKKSEKAKSLQCNIKKI